RHRAIPSALSAARGLRTKYARTSVAKSRSDSFDRRNGVTSDQIALEPNTSPRPFQQAACHPDLGMESAANRYSGHRKRDSGVPPEAHERARIIEAARRIFDFVRWDRNVPARDVNRVGTIRALHAIA